MLHRRVVIAVPVKDESETLAPCLHALVQQDAPDAAKILVLVNNSTDTSAAIARSIGAALPGRIIVEDVLLPADRASAGAARRLAMNMAADLAGEGGIILTTDADSVPSDWLRANLREIEAGADAVAGRAVIDPADEAQIPATLIEADARECAYAALLDEIAAEIDPDPADPWPRHDEHSGASIAVTVNAFRRAGGIPDLAMGEDRAFFNALRRIDARIRHAPDIRVIVSGRTEGRAIGGMADTIRRRLVCPDLFLDDRLESVPATVARATLRRRARVIWIEGATDRWAIAALARNMELPSAWVREKLSAAAFGAGWDDLQAASPIMRRYPVPATSVTAEIAAARLVLAQSPEPTEQTIGLSA